LTTGSGQVVEKRVGMSSFRRTHLYRKVLLHG
jgi:hypothetical protein